jgi:AmmeMemoRadiSam system protein B
MTTVRAPAVAGQFYPGQPERLKKMVADFLAQAKPAGTVPKAIIAPHAGYVYSGPIAASAYASLLAAGPTIRRVILLGPAHRVSIRGLAASGADAFATPLGTVPVDKAAVNEILELPQVQVHDAAHAQEHSLEVHLPFLQQICPDFSIVPLAVGAATAAEVAQVLEKLWGGPETLIVISSDLSHYHEYETARNMDQETSKAIEDLQPEAIGRDQACGRIPIQGLLQLARQRGLKAQTVDLRSSGDTAGPRSEVVGYGAYLFS